MNLILAIVLLTAAGVVSGYARGRRRPADWAVSLQLFLTTGGWLNLVLLALDPCRSRRSTGPASSHRSRTVTLGCS